MILQKTFNLAIRFEDFQTNSDIYMMYDCLKTLQGFMSYDFNMDIEELYLAFNTKDNAKIGRKELRKLGFTCSDNIVENIIEIDSNNEDQLETKTN